MTDDDIWLIRCNPRISAPKLAERLGVTTLTIHRWRKRFRQEGWTCRVNYGPCVYCGETMTVRPSKNEAFSHPACKAAEKRKGTRGYHSWAPEEDVLLWDKRLTIRQVAAAVGVTYQSVAKRRYVLRRSGLAPDVMPE